MKPFRYGRRFIDPDSPKRYRRWIDPRVASLRGTDVAAYLRARNWIEVTPDRPGFLVFQELNTPAGQEPFYQFVPDSKQDPNYRREMFDLLTGLAEFEDRQASAVIDDILKLANQRQHGNGVVAGQSADVETLP